MTIGLFATSDDTHAQAMAERLSRDGQEIVYLANDQFPGMLGLSMGDGRYALEGRDLEDIRVWYVRAIATALPIVPLGDGTYTAGPGAKAQYIAEREKQAFVAAWLKGLELSGKAVVNALGPMDQHFAKPYQVELLRLAGLPVPRTLVTNDPAALRTWAEINPDAIYKPVAGGAHTRILQPSDLDEDRLAALASAPVIFQERIVGDNLRVYVVGDRVVSAAVIHTRHVDFRQGVDRIERLDLAPDLARMCVKACKVCDLAYSGVDVMREPNGRHVLLECNPSPMYQVWDNEVGDDVEGAIAAYLTQLALVSA